MTIYQKNNASPVNIVKIFNWAVQNLFHDKLLSICLKIIYFPIGTNNYLHK